MASRYGYQFNAGYKPKMVNVEGFVSIGTGGLPNSVVGLQTSSGLSTSGTYWGTLPGCPTAGVPTGWNGTFSGAIGLYGAGVAGVARIATGLYSVMLSDDYVRLDSVQITPLYAAVMENNGGSTGIINSYDANIVYHTVGFGNTVTTGAISQSNASGVANTNVMSGLVGQNLKNQVLVQFSVSAPSGSLGGTGTLAGGTPNIAADLPNSGGFFIALRLRDSLAGVQ